MTEILLLFFCSCANVNKHMQRCRRETRGSGATCCKECARNTTSAPIRKALGLGRRQKVDSNWVYDDEFDEVSDSESEYSSDEASETTESDLEDEEARADEENAQEEAEANGELLYSGEEEDSSDVEVEHDYQPNAEFKHTEPYPLPSTTTQFEDMDINNEKMTEAEAQ